MKDIGGMTSGNSSNLFLTIYCLDMYCLKVIFHCCIVGCASQCLHAFMSMIRSMYIPELIYTPRQFLGNTSFGKMSFTDLLKFIYMHNFRYTVMTQTFRTDRSGQTVQTQIRLLLEEQSDQGLHCLLFHLHHFDKIPFSFGLFV